MECGGCWINAELISAVLKALSANPNMIPKSAVTEDRKSVIQIKMSCWNVQVVLYKYPGYL